MSEADETQLPQSSLIKNYMWIETLHLSASLHISTSLTCFYQNSYSLQITKQAGPAGTYSLQV